MRNHGTPLHIASVLFALASAPASAQVDSGLPPADGAPGCGGWATSVGAADVPANIPSFQVILFGADAASGSIGLLRRTPSGDEAVDADVVTEVLTDVPDGHAYTLVPRAPLAVGVPHVLWWGSACSGLSERTYGVGPAIPLPAPPATVTATLIQEVRAGSREDRYVRVDLDLAADVTPWIDALRFEVVVDGSTRAPLFLPYEGTTRVSGDLFVQCTGRSEGRTPRVEEGTHVFRAAVGGFGVAPVLEASTTAAIDCASPQYIHAEDGTPLTAAEIAALPPETPPPTGDAAHADAAVVSADAAVASDAAATPPPPSSGCSAGRATHGAWGVLVLAAAALARRRRARAIL